MTTKTLAELLKAEFRRLKRTFPISYAKTDGDRTMIYCYVGEANNQALFKRLYDGETVYVQGLLNSGFEDE
jgi:hypothetical protein